MSKTDPRHPKVVMDDPEQSERFIEAARELGCEETGEAFERAVGRILPPRQPGQAATKREPRKKPEGRRRRNKGAG
jgi:hypothetical protein